MNCAHEADTSDYDCCLCATMWMWNAVIFCRTCVKAVLRFQYVIENETVGTDVEIATVNYRGKKYVYKGVFNGDYETMVVSMSNGRMAFKVAVATFLGVTNIGLAAFLHEHAATHESTDRRVVHSVLAMQETSVHSAQFGFCGYYVNSVQDLSENIAEIMSGITIPNYPGVYVCIDELQNVMGDSCDSCEKLVEESRDEYKYPVNFNPGDPRSVRETVEGFLNM